MNEQLLQVNLLPWREKARQLNKYRFYTLSVCFALLTVLTALSWHIYYRSLNNEQIDLNQYLLAEIEQQKIAINNINQKDREKFATQKQLQFISQLIKTGYQSIGAINQLVALVPNTVFLTSIKKNDNVITLTALTQQDTDIALLKKQIASTSESKVPRTAITANEKGNLINFSLEFDLKNKDKNEVQS